MSGLVLALGLFQTAPGTALPDLPEAYPFGVGETFAYSGKMGFFNVGGATISIPAIDTLRGVPSFVFRFEVNGGLPIYRLNSVMESRTGMADFRSRQFIQDSDENGRDRYRRYEIYPDSGFFLAQDDTTHWPTPAQPLDDAAFLYFVRTLPLQAGKTYALDYYFKQERNPLTIKVEKRERCELPGKVQTECFVIHPVIGDKGIFGPRANARVWITTDARRIPVQIRSTTVGTVTLRLERMSLVPPTPRPRPGAP